MLVALHPESTLIIVIAAGLGRIQPHIPALMWRVQMAYRGLSCHAVWLDDTSNVSSFYSFLRKWLCLVNP